MKNKNVRYDYNVEKWIKTAMSEEFCMGWNPVRNNEDIYVKFIDNKNYEEIILSINGKLYEFDRFSTCYSLLQ